LRNNRISSPGSRPFGHRRLLPDFHSSSVKFPLPNASALLPAGPQVPSQEQHSPIFLVLTLSWVRQPLIFEGPRQIGPEKYILPSALLALGKALDQIDLSANRKSQWRSVKSLGADRPKGFPFSKAAFVACRLAMLASLQSN